MRKICQKLKEKVSWHKKWQTKPMSSFLHNLILLVVAPLFGLLILPSALAYVQTVQQAKEPFPAFYIPPTPTPTPVPTPIVKIQTYTVQTGDSLWSIAQKFLGDGSRYDEIIEWNKDKFPQLLTNPNLIEPGMSLVVSKTVVPPPGGIVGPRPQRFESGGEISSELLDFLDIFNIVSLVFLGLLIVVGAARWLIIRL